VSDHTNQGMNARDVAELLAFGIDVHPFPLDAGAITSNGATARFEITGASGSRFDVVVTQTTVGKAQAGDRIR
jgi:hypothetical protein